ncbi:unnamed protein product [Amoebophrya sp. A25]|nr:unnamed protein product [Amoebophrya sp. A25]|eukprot:GSA25T00001124001.1
MFFIIKYQRLIFIEEKLANFCVQAESPHTKIVHKVWRDHCEKKNLLCTIKVEVRRRVEDILTGSGSQRPSR